MSEEVMIEKPKKRREKGEDNEEKKKKKKKKKTSEPNTEENEKRKKKKKKKSKCTEKAPLQDDEDQVMKKSFDCIHPPSISPPPSPHPTFVASNTPIRQEEPQHEGHPQEQQQQQQELAPPSIAPPEKPHHRIMSAIIAKEDRMRDRYRHGTLHLVSMFQFVRADTMSHTPIPYIIPTTHAYHDTLLEYFISEDRHPAEALRMAQNVAESRPLADHELAAYVGLTVVPEDTPGVWSSLINNNP